MKHISTEELLKHLLELHEEMYYGEKTEHSELDCDLIELIKERLEIYE